MNLLHLHYFHVVAKEGSFIKASHVLKINQPALSRMVKQLEESLKIVLLERQPRGVRLTSLGAQVFQKASEIFSKVNELKSATGQLSQICQGELRLGTTDLIARQLLVKATKTMVDTWPLVYPIIQSGSAAELLPLIANGRLEFGFFFHLPRMPHSLAITRRWPFQFHLVVAKEVRTDREVLDRFIGSREIDDTFNRKFPTLARWKRKNPNAQIAFSSNSLLFHHQLVLAGAGISVLPRFLIQDDLRRGKVVDVMPKENLMFDMKLVQRKNVALSVEAKAFFQSLEIGR